jgi:hypothetical protein
MKWSSLVALLALCCLLGAKATTRPNSQPTTRPIPNILHFSEFGYSLTPLQGMQTLAMTLPPTEQFTPTINVIDQPYPGTLDDYITLSKGEMDKANDKIISATKIGTDSAVFEYIGSLGGPELHWYAKAVHKPGHVYLAKATATITQWDTISGQLKSCVDSLRLDKQ